MMQWLNEKLILFLIAVLGASSLAGLAALLRSGKELTSRDIFSSLLNSGIMGAGVFAVWWSYGGESNPILAAGVCTLAGLGGTATVEFVAASAKRVIDRIFGGENNGNPHKK